VTVQQSDITRDELNEIRDIVAQEAKETGIEFGSGLNYRTGKVRVYADEINALRESLENNEVIAPLLDRLEFIQESGVAPADYDYPYFPGGHATMPCTSGFPVYRTSDSARFISTSGHCDNSKKEIKCARIRQSLLCSCPSC
jgi:hypothetical protein